ncbi:related to protein [Lichtheimia corymbifera JMRC:FSU:9682]|uniref:Related to protein n=1 Tax=Lichtheimia corymbifera JMRC:FSU:9682 TaxID=1263082 RepID=A0A068SBZ3_9FUNG|nr:related to protein [Lichtheimia corymbifera JMRC:FSU:9682]
MREPNFSFPAQNRATVVISSALYDRRALDCTATLPLVNSLTHLAYMTSTSPRIREILAADGGLERLVKILATCQHTDRHSLWKWSLAFQCVVNVGVRGTEAIRSRVVETGAVQVVLSILENFLHALEQARNESEQERNNQQQQQQQQQQSIPPSSNVSLTATLPPTQSRSTPIITSSTITSPSPRSLFSPTALNNSNNEEESSLSSISIERPFASPPRRRTFLTRSPKQKFKPADPSLSSIPMLNNLSSDAVLHREEDILLSLQLLAYLSKYPHIRESFHKNYRRNIFSVVERFTYRLHPTNVTYWAGVIMRNACRKDEARGGIRQCAYMHCGKWERFPREFAKCRRCRKAKYCSKQCQSRAWQEGHRWWCVERHHAPNTTTTTATQDQQQQTTNAAATTTTMTTTHGDGNNTNLAVTTATPTPPTATTPTTTTTNTATASPPADTAQVMPLDTTQHGTAPDVLPIQLDGTNQQNDMDVEPANTVNDTNTATTTTHHSITTHHHSSNPENTSSSNDHHLNHHPHPSSSSSSLLTDPSRRRRNSRITHSVPSGSSTEAEADAADSSGGGSGPLRDLMDID